MEKKPATLLFWSPAGSIVLMANLKGTSGQLEWFDVNAMQTIGEAEHFMCSDIEWDPTGRFVATSVAHWRHQMENGYNIWTSQGRQIKHQRQDKFFQLLWRPRPPSLLSDAQEKEVRKNLREYSKKYEAEDALARAGMQGDLLKDRQNKSKAFEEGLKWSSGTSSATGAGGWLWAMWDFKCDSAIVCTDEWGVQALGGLGLTHYV